MDSNTETDTHIETGTGWVGSLVHRQHSLPLSVALHLIPGALIVGAYFLVASPLVSALGYPPYLGWVIAMCVALVPAELGLLLYLGWRTNGRLSLRGVVDYREKPLRPGRLAAIVAGLIVAVFVASIALNPVDTAVYKALFSWIPFEATAKAGGFLDGYPRATVVATLVVSLVFVGGIGPVVEELYFRGFLLPRVRAHAPVWNAVLFSLYHLWTPWQFFSRIGFFLPTVWVTWRTKDLRVSLLVHCLSNSLLQLVVLAAILSGAGT